MVRAAAAGEPIAAPHRPGEFVATIDEIDFGRLYREHLQAASRLPKPAEAWDERAAGMRQRSRESRYAESFIARMNLEDATTLLDVGCGPGTICIPIAHRFEKVYGLDYSAAMLDALRANAAERGLTNIEALHLAWEDDWSQVPVCDIVVASRSTSVQDLAAALAKLDAKARRRVYLTHRMGGRPVPAAALEAIGRKLRPPPDYIYALNILHGMGIHPRLDYIESENRLAAAGDFEEFARRIAWSIGALSTEETSRLRAWYEHAPQAIRTEAAPVRWAFISWEKC